MIPTKMLSFAIAILTLTSACDDSAERRRVATAFPDPTAVRFKNFHMLDTIACGEISPSRSIAFRRFIVGDLYSPDAHINYEPADPIERPEDMDRLTTLDGQLCSAGKTAFMSGTAKFPALECTMVDTDRERYAATTWFLRIWKRCMDQTPTE